MSLRSLRKAFVWFCIELTLLAIGYCLVVLWSGVFITGMLLGDVLLFAFLTVLFILDTAIAARNGSETEEDAQVDAGCFPETRWYSSTISILISLGNSRAT